MAAACRDVTALLTVERRALIRRNERRVSSFGFVPPPSEGSLVFSLFYLKKKEQNPKKEDGQENLICTSEGTAGHVRGPLFEGSEKKQRQVS